MLPTLNGRIQTRIFATLIIGGLWTLIIAPLLPSGASASATYKSAFIVLVTVCVLGIALGDRLPRGHAVPVGEGLAHPVRVPQRRSTRACWCGSCWPPASCPDIPR